jgi:DHA2 family multidrug resistance protein
VVVLYWLQHKQLLQSYPIAKRGMAQAIYGMGVIVGPTLGPPLGGYLVDNSYIFYINIPLELSRRY